MSEITRRQLLAFFGVAAAVQATPALLRPLRPGAGLAEAAWAGAFTSVRVPHPLPIYQTHSRGPVRRFTCSTPARRHPRLTATTSGPAAPSCR
jgi:hypothetical protein